MRYTEIHEKCWDAGENYSFLEVSFMNMWSLPGWKKFIEQTQSPSSLLEELKSQFLIQLIMRRALNGLF